MIVRPSMPNEQHFRQIADVNPQLVENGQATTELLLFTVYMEWNLNLKRLPIARASPLAWCGDAICRDQSG